MTNGGGGGEVAKSRASILNIETILYSRRKKEGRERKKMIDLRCGLDAGFWGFVGFPDVSCAVKVKKGCT